MANEAIRQTSVTTKFSNSGLFKGDEKDLIAVIEKDELAKLCKEVHHKAEDNDEVAVWDGEDDQSLQTCQRSLRFSIIDFFYAILYGSLASPLQRQSETQNNDQLIPELNELHLETAAVGEASSVHKERAERPVRNNNRRKRNRRDRNIRPKKQYKPPTNKRFTNYHQPQGNR